MSKPRVLTDEQVANRFVRGKAAYAGVMEVVYIAARLEVQLESAVTAHQKAHTFDTIDQLIAEGARQAAEVAGMCRLIAAAVHRYEFMTASFGDGDNLDPDGTRSRHVMELLLQHAAEHNRQQDEPTPGDEEDHLFWWLRRRSA
ncbi:hypothetical protein [Nonomuraea sp. SYSU D8015]|uniref:hypothetical protein n=1 Tax=Nonomuraea sp. SYSU D8015 TaxID=2593644 RepID=UPI001660A1E5|nr:hypothetical protein [Nonomuraea sp. SYSU D8015]